MMRSFCDDQIINQAICYFTVVICYIDCLLCFPTFALVRRQMLGLSSIWRMSESRSQTEVLELQKPNGEAKAGLFSLF